VRALLHRGSAAFVLLGMFCASLLMWVGIPIGWLWIGSQIEGATQSLGAAVGAMAIGVVATILLAIPVLGWLSDRYRAVRVARGQEDTGHFALEVMLVLSSGTAIVAFLLWFFVFAGSEPVPVGISF
jgi:MFS family permease